MTNDVPIHHYAKGEAKRREILAAAFTLIGERGFRSSSLQEIADAVGMSKAGVLHYFGSREELLAEVLQQRDEVDAEVFYAQDGQGDVIDLLSRSVRHNETVPGLVQLYSRLVADAESPEHSAHGYIGDRYARTVSATTESVRERQASGSLNANLDPEVVARLLVAVSDGIQLQWAYDTAVDMTKIFDTAIAILGATMSAPVSQDA